MRASLGAKPAAGVQPDPDYSELYTRWIQWGVFSPILRTHTTKDPQSERRIWAYPAQYASAMDILNTSWPNGWSPDILIEAAQAGRRMTLQPSTARAELEKLQRDMPAIVEAIAKMNVDCRRTATALRHLGREAVCVPAVK